MTKNVAKMWEDYAKARGMSAANLTQSQKVEAEYLGIMQETAAQVGNAAEAANTLAGAQATTSTAAHELATAFGEAMAPAVQLVNEALTGILGAVKDFVSASPELTAGLTTAATAVAGMMAASKAAEAVMALGAAFKAASGGVTLFGGAVSLSMPWLAGIAAAIGLAVTAYTGFKRAAQEAAEAEEKAKAARKQEVVDLRTNAGHLRQLADEYTKLAAKENKSYADKARMLEIEQELGKYQDDLAEKYGISTGAADKNAEAHKGVAEALRDEAKAYEELAKAKNGEFEKTPEQERADAFNALSSAVKTYSDSLKDLSADYKRYQDYLEKYANDPTESATTNYQAMQGQYNEWTDRLENEKKAAIAALNDYADAVKAEAISNNMDIAGGMSDAQAAAIDAVTNALSQSLQTALENGGNFKELTDQFQDDLENAVTGILFSSGVQDAIGAMQQISDKIFSGIAPDQADKKALQDAFGEIASTVIESLPQEMEAQAKSAAVSTALQAILNTVFNNAFSSFSAGGFKFEELFDGMVEIAQAKAPEMAKAASDTILQLSQPLQAVGESAEQAAERATKGIDEIRASAKAVAGDASAVEAEYQKSMDTLGRYKDILSKLDGKSFEDATNTQQEALKALSDEFHINITDAASFGAALTHLKDQIAKTEDYAQQFQLPGIENARKSIDEFIGALQTQLANLDPSASNFDQLSTYLNQQITDFKALQSSLALTSLFYQGWAQSAQSSGQQAAQATKDPLQAAQDAARAYKDAADEYAKWQNMQTQMSTAGSYENMAANDAENLQMISDALGMVIDSQEDFDTAMAAVKANVDAMKAAASASLKTLQAEYTNLNTAITETRGKLANATAGTDEYDQLTQSLAVLEAAYKAVGIAIDSYQEKAKKSADTTKNDAETKQKTTDDYVSGVEQALTEFKSAQDEYQKMSQTMAELSKYDSFEEAMAKNADAVKALSDMLDMSITNQDEFLMAMEEAQYAKTDYANSSNDARDALKTEIDALTEYQKKLEKQVETTKEGSAENKKAQKDLNKVNAALSKAKRAYDNYIKKSRDAAKETAKTSKSNTQAEKALKKYEKELESTAKAYKSNLEKKAALDAAMSKIESIEKAHGSLADVNKILQKLPGDLKTTVKSFDDAKKYIQNNSDKINNAIKGQLKSYQNELKKWEDAKKAAQQTGTTQIKLSANLTATVTTSQIDQKIAEIKKKIKEFNDLAKQIGAPTTGGGGGGGGGGNKESEYAKENKQQQHRIKLFSEFDLNATKKELAIYEGMYDKYTKRLNAIDNSRMSDRQKKRAKEKIITEDEYRSLQETIHDLRERERKEAFDDDMAKFDHAVAMGRMSTKKQIEYLKKVLKNHKLTRDERWQIEEQIYDLEQDLADKAKEKEEKRLEAIKKKAEDAKKKAEEALEKQKEKATTVYDQLVEALRNRYDKERELRKKALQDEIDALEKEQEAEDEAREQKEYEEQLAEKQRELRIEKSARRRREIEKEIEEMILEEQQRQQDKARQARIDQLNAQIDEIDERYDKLTSDENLNKEALTMALSGNMKAMEKIIKDYTPKFENAGEALMTYLTNGVTAKKTSLLNTMSKVFDAAGKTMQHQIATLSETTAAKAGNVTVNLSIGSVNQASDYKTVMQKLADAVRSASRGKK